MHADAILISVLWLIGVGFAIATLFGPSLISRVPPSKERQLATHLLLTGSLGGAFVILATLEPGHWVVVAGLLLVLACAVFGGIVTLKQLER